MGAWELQHVGLEIWWERGCAGTGVPLPQVPSSPVLPSGPIHNPRWLWGETEVRIGRGLGMLAFCVSRPCALWALVDRVGTLAQDRCRPRLLPHGEDFKFWVGAWCLGECPGR